MMDESNGQSGEENIINILVIKEPSEWQQTVTDCSLDGPSMLESVGEKNKEVVEDTRGVICANSCNPFNKSQSFVIGSQLDPKIDGIHPLSKNQLSFRNGVEIQESFVGGLYKADKSSIAPNLSFGHNNLGLNSNVQITNKDCQGIFDSYIDEQRAQRIKLGRHKSISLPVENQSCPIERTFPKISASDVSPQVFTSSLYYSPGLLSQNRIVNDSETPKVTTTPDSGFCTPSQFEPASANVFFTSTPRSSKSICPKTSTPCLSETPKGPIDSLHQKFSELYNAVDWESFDDSCDLSEDPKEDSIEYSPNSSLRSVQWLKGFSIGDSVKPLSSPPTPGDSKRLKTCNQIQGLHDQPSSSSGHLNKEDSYTSSVSNTSSAVPATSARNVFSTAALTPLPVIMAPTVPTYLQNQPIISSQVATQGSKAQDDSVKKDKSHQRKALEELKMNKAERNIGRSKFTGKIFSRPGYSYMDLIKMAMQTSKDGEMTLKEIVTWIEDHFPFFKHEAKDSWKSSIRHNLSLHSDFMKADDKKHGCKWKLCKDAKVQHNLHVPAPQEITSQQSAYLKKVKRNAPQPILPKVNAYALVPIHNLTNSMVDTQQQPVAPLPRKPVHILPKQLEDPQTLSHLQEEYYHCHQGQNHPSQHHHIIQQLLQKAPQSNLGVGVLTDQILDSSSTDIAFQGIYTSCDNNLNQSMSISSAYNINQPISHTQTGIAYPMSSTHFVEDDQIQESNTVTYLVEENSEATAPESQDVSQNFPMNSVVEIREELGTKPGEKKIIFVLQDSENIKQKMKHIQSSSKDISTKSSIKSLSSKFCNKQSSNSKTSSCFGRKKSKDGQKSRQPRGPVLNLQSVLQSSQEDKRASDTIGMLLLEEDEERLVYDDSEDFHSFTQVKVCSKQEEMHLNSHMQRAFLEQGWNNYPTDMDRPVAVYPQENSYPERFPNESHLNSTNGKSSLSSNLKRVGRRERMTIIKNRNQSSDSLDSVTHKTMDCYPSSNSVATKKASSSQDNSIVPSCNTPSASQLVFRRLSSGDQSSSLLSSFSSHSSSSSFTPLSDVSEKDDSIRRRVGNSSRSKSRRKQVHVPLTNEVSPVRNSSSVMEEEMSWLTGDKEKSASFINVASEKQLQIKNFSVRTEQSMPLLMDIQQPSLEILQHKPLELSLHTPSKEKPFQNRPEENLDFLNCINSNSKDIENIFCMGSPVKVKSEKNIFSENATDNLFLSEFETPPSLHFLSTFAKETDFSQVLNNKVSSHDDKFSNQSDRISVLLDSNSKSLRYRQFPVNFLEEESELYSCIGNMQSVSLKRVCRDENRGYGVLNTTSLSMPEVKETTGLNTRSTLSSSNALSSPSMDTPPCGTRLRPPTSTSTSMGLKLVHNDTSDKSCLVSPSTHPLPPSSYTNNQQSLLLSPSIHFLGSPADIVTPFTPPCGNTPFMSTPSHHLWSMASDAQQDMLPSPGNLSGILDASFNENLDSFINSLPGHSDNIGLGSIFPSIQQSPQS